MTINIFILLIGFALLIFGGGWLVKAAVSLSLRLKVKPAVIALTIIAFGTSAPELITSSLASWQGAPDAALGNVIGSNIFNAFAVLGFSCLILSNTMEKHTRRVELPFLLFISIVTVLLGFDSTYSRPEGFLLIFLLVFFWTYSIRRARKQGLSSEKPSEKQEEIISLGSLQKELLFLLIGFTALAYGAHLALSSALEIGTSLGISERILGITVLSVGTGLPELITSVIAAKKGHSDIAIGNVIGSNILNLLGVLGTTVAISPMSASKDIIHSDAYWMIGSTLLILALIHGNSISRKGGGLLSLSYIFYIAYTLFT